MPLHEPAACGRIVVTPRASRETDIGALRDWIYIRT